MHRFEDTPFQIEHVADVPFQVASLQEATAWLLNVAVPQRQAVNVRLANAWNVALANDDQQYMRLLSDHGINLPDGAPVVWFMNARRRDGRTSLANRVRGPSFFTEVIGQSAHTTVRHFLLGGSQQTLNELVIRLQDKHPDLNLVGAYSPPYEPVTPAYVEDCARRIAESKADIVWVGLGTPKQDYVGTELAKLLEMPTVNVGAAFDFSAGTAAEAPKWIQRWGFEWFFRLVSEPRRLWRRYTYGNMRFLIVAIAGHVRPRVSLGGSGARDMGHEHSAGHDRRESHS